MIGEDDIVILCAEPRLLALQVTKQAFRFGVLAGHCPHSGRQQERTDFMKRLRSLLRSTCRTEVIIGGLDANARPPPSYAQVTGDLEYGEADASGQQLVEALHEDELWVPSTFSALHHGDSATYQTPCGQEHRIDFVLLGGRRGPDQVRAWVGYDFDTANINEDHRAVEAELLGHTAAHEFGKRLRRPAYNRSQCLRSKDDRPSAGLWNSTAPPAGKCMSTVTASTSKII